MKQNTSIIVILCGISSLPAFVSTGLGAIFPALKLTLNLNGIQMGFLFSFATIATIMAAPIFGSIADRRGLFQTILPLLFLYVAGSIICGLSFFANTCQFWYLIIGRLLEGLGTVGAIPLIISLAKSLWGDRGIIKIARIEASISIGAVVGPLVGGILADVGWFWLFWLEGSIMFILALILFITVIPHKEELNREKPTLNSSTPIPCQRSFPSLETIGAFIGGSALSFSLVGMQLYIIDYFRVNFLLPVLIGSIVVSAHALVMAATSALSATFLQYNRSRVMIVIGLLIFAFALVIIGLQAHIILLISILIVSGLGCGIIFPSVNTVILNSFRRDQQSRDISLSISFRNLGALLGGFVIGWLTSFNYSLAFIINGVVLAIFAMICLILLFHQCMQKPLQVV